MKKTILVTGAAGFLGSHLCEKYLNQNFNVIGCDNFSTGLKSNIDELTRKHSENFKFFELDVCLGFSSIENKVQKEWLNQLAYVFHFASPASPIHYQRLGLETLWVNTIGLSQCLSIADTYKSRVIFASTSEVYGDPNCSPQPESYWGNVNSFGERSCYDEAKRFGEALIFTHNKKYSTKHGLVRIFNTYGPRMNPNDGRVVINFILQALENKEITIYGDGLQTRSFCYVDDLTTAISKYAQGEFTFPINIGNDTEYNMIQLAEITIAELGSKSKIVFKPLPADDPKQRRPDLTLAKKFLNYQPSIPVQQGIKVMAKWLSEINLK